jgi:hypothetical protein
VTVLGEEELALPGIGREPERGEDSRRIESDRKQGRTQGDQEGKSGAELVARRDQLNHGSAIL